MDITIRLNFTGSNGDDLCFKHAAHRAVNDHESIKVEGVEQNYSLDNCADCHVEYVARCVKEAEKEAIPPPQVKPISSKIEWRECCSSLPGEPHALKCGEKK